MHHFSDTATGKYIQNISDDKLAHHNQLPTKNIQILVLDTSYCQYIQVKCWLLGKLCTIDEVNRRLCGIQGGVFLKRFVRGSFTGAIQSYSYTSITRIGGVRVVCGGVQDQFYRYKKISSVCSGGRGDTPLPRSGQLTLELCGSDSVHFVLKAVSKQSDLVFREYKSVSSKVLKYIYKQSTIHAYSFMVKARHQSKH